MKIKYTLFASLAKGGYLRLFDCVDYPGMAGMIFKDNRNSPIKKEIYVGEKIFSSSEEAISEYKNRKVCNKCNDLTLVRIHGGFRCKACGYQIGVNEQP